MSNKNLELQYKSLLNAVKLAIDEWNPYGLLPDAPNDEFAAESSMIAARIQACDSIERIAEIVSIVFSRKFEHRYFCVSDCMDVAEKINLNITKNRLHLT